MSGLLFALLLFPLLNIALSGAPGLTADEPFFFRASLLGNPGLKHWFALPYAGMAKQVIADIWFSLFDFGQIWKPWMIRLPWILLWTVGIGLHMAALKCRAGTRAAWIFLALTMLNPDLSWSARVDIGENSLSTIFLGVLFFWVSAPSRMHGIFPVAALWLGGWSRLNFYWAAAPFLILFPGPIRFSSRLIVSASGAVLGAWLVWNSKSVGSGLLDFPWNTPNPLAISRHFLHSLAGRMAAVNAFHSEQLLEATWIGSASLAALTGAWIFIAWRNLELRIKMVKVILFAAALTIFHAFYTGLLGYWHLAYLLPLAIAGLAWTVEIVWRIHRWAGLGLLLFLITSTLSGWDAIRINQNLKSLQTMFTPAAEPMMEFCRNQHCIASDVGIYDNILTQRPPNGATNLGFVGAKPPELNGRIKMAQENFPDGWWVFWSMNRTDISHNLPIFLSAWKDLEIQTLEARSIDDQEGLPVYVLFRLGKEKSSKRN